MKKILPANFEKLQFEVFYLIKQGLEHEVKSFKQVPLNFIIVYSGFKKINAVSFEICCRIKAQSGKTGKILIL